MAYWWVNQGKTYEEESNGSFLWAPLKNKSGNTEHHWKTVEILEAGDTVFSYSNGYIKAYSTVLKKAYKSINPFNQNNELWKKEGNKVDLVFNQLETHIPLNSFNQEMKKTLQNIHSPLNKNAAVNQGYLFSITNAAALILIQQIESHEAINIEETLEKNIKNSLDAETTIEALIKSRKGQGKFRKDLKDIWKNKCSITNSSLTDILVASHIKAWKFSNNKERLDPLNGLLLSPTYDKLFDKGYISFNNKGEILISKNLNQNNIVQLSINVSAKLSQPLSPKTCEYLQFHRELYGF